MKSNKQTVVVVGGGFGGLKTVIDLQKTGRFNIVLVSDSDYFSYYPSLYHTATGGSRDVSAIPLLELLDPEQIDVVYGKAVRLDRAQKRVITDSGEELSYDYVVFSIGVVTNYFNIPGLQQLSFGIKSIEDAEEFKQHLHQQITDERKPDLNYVIVGGGPTGIELAGVLGDYVRYIMKKHGIKNRKVHIDLIEAGPRLVPKMPKALSKRLARQLRLRGVRLYLNSVVKGQTADELLVNGKPIRSHTVVWTAGVANNPFFADQNFQLSSTGKVRVDQYLQAEPGIFVIGDNADTPYSGMAQTAIYDGQYVSYALESISKHEAPKPYRAKKPIYVFPAGPNWAAVLWGPVKMYGFVGWLLRRAADFVGYKDYEPFFKATKQWFTEYDEEDLCPVCQPYEVKNEKRFESI